MIPTPVDRMRPDRATVAVTGATGYVGGRLVPRLLERGHTVRCLVRDPAKVGHRPWADHPRLEVVRSDLRDAGATARALQGCIAAAYLVHSMVSAGRDYDDTDRRLAAAFAEAASRADVDHIVYLGGLGGTGTDASGVALSRHLASRRAVEEALASGPVPVTVLRAAMILGSGSASFEILRYLTERLPVMVTPRWVRTECQPIAIRDVLRYLVTALEEPGASGRTLEIGGPDVLTYAGLIHLTAEVLGLRRRVLLPVPLLTPRLSSWWIHLVTPVPARLARPLTEGLCNRVVCQDDRARRAMPGPLTSAREAIAAAVGRQRTGGTETSWSDAGILPGDPDWAGDRVCLDERSIRIGAPADRVYRAVCRLGGRQGWYAAGLLWRLRGAIDRLVGGPGLQRGRRHPERLGRGDALDFWRVTRAVPGRLLELRAEMRLPGEGTLTFTVTPEGGGSTGSVLRQTARFRPRGLAGLAYWYGVLPLHAWVFRGMLRGIRRRAEGGPPDALG